MAKFYVVWQGKTPGIYTSWQDCQAQIHGFAGAKYKSFKSQIEAERAFHGTTLDRSNANIVMPSLSVDAACSGNPGIMEYRGVETETGAELFKPPPFPMGTNNLGEFLAIVHGLAYLHENNLDWPIYTDSKTALSWVRNAKVKSNLPDNEDTRVLWDLVQRGEAFLKNNRFKTTLLKWDTENWGEIPADFGRK